MVGAALRDLLGASTRIGACTGVGVRTGNAGHPVCGDEVQLSVRLDAGRFVDVRWRATGCPASMAVAALAADVLVGVAVGAAADVLRQAIARHGGLAAAERHAEALVLRAVAAASGGAA